MAILFEEDFLLIVTYYDQIPAIDIDLQLKSMHVIFVKVLSAQFQADWF